MKLMVKDIYIFRLQLQQNIFISGLIQETLSSFYKKYSRIAS